MSHASDADPFKRTAEYYAGSRPGYGEETITYVVDRFDHADDARLLDLGCVTGQIAIPLSEYAGSVIAMDPNESMIEAGRQCGEDAGVTNIE
ncbi:class I SAM-dependent methyltransferase [Halapricum salinum]|uniref:class I SAM-dependent methyltransferase n=1 Tax=Halapricum salinum TaxID=1457250 RepID=UPI000679D4E5|nr:methyltransferase domain-containing protein [Halapricum salinum]